MSPRTPSRRAALCTICVGLLPALCLTSCATHAALEAITQPGRELSVLDLEAAALDRERALHLLLPAAGKSGDNAGEYHVTLQASRDGTIRVGRSQVVPRDAALPRDASPVGVLTRERRERAQEPGARQSRPRDGTSIQVELHGYSPPRVRIHDPKHDFSQEALRDVELPEPRTPYSAVDAMAGVVSLPLAVAIDIVLIPAYGVVLFFFMPSC